MPNRELLDPARYPLCENGADSIRVWNDESATRAFYDAKVLSKKKVIDFSRCGVPDEIRSLVWQQLVHKRFGTAFHGEENENQSTGYTLRLRRPSAKKIAVSSFPPPPATYSATLKLYFNGNPPLLEDCALLGGTLLREYTALNEQGYTIAARILAILHYESLLPSFYSTSFRGPSSNASATTSASSNLNLSLPGGSNNQKFSSVSTATTMVNNPDAPVDVSIKRAEALEISLGGSINDKKSKIVEKSVASVSRGVSGSPIQYCPFLASLTVLLLHHSPTDAVLSIIRTLVRRAIDRPALLRRQARSRPLRSNLKAAYQYLPLGKHDLRCLNHAFGLLALSVPECPTQYIVSINPTKLPLWGRWFCDFFVGVLPMPHVFRIIDEYLVEGCVALFRYGLALLALCRSQITEASVWRNLCILFARPNEIFFTPEELAAVANTMRVTAKDLVLKEEVRVSLLPKEPKSHHESIGKNSKIKQGTRKQPHQIRHGGPSSATPTSPKAFHTSPTSPSKNGSNKLQISTSDSSIYQQTRYKQQSQCSTPHQFHSLNINSPTPMLATTAHNRNTTQNAACNFNESPSTAEHQRLKAVQAGRRHISQLLGTIATRSTESLTEIIEIRRQAADRDCVRTGEIPEFVPPCERLIKSHVDPALPGILTNRHWAAIWANVPPQIRIQRLEMLFSTESDGRSFQTLFRLIQEREPLLIFIRTVTRGEVFGAFITASVPENHITPRFTGTGDSFVFTLVPEIKIISSAVARGQNPNASMDRLHSEYEYRAVELARRGKSLADGANSLTKQMAAEMLDKTRKPEPEIEGYLFTKRRELMIGAGKFGFSIYLMDDLNRGETQASTTFPHGPLLPDVKFEIERMDVYSTNSEIPGFRGRN